MSGKLDHDKDNQSAVCEDTTLFVSSAGKASTEAVFEQTDGGTATSIFDIDWGQQDDGSFETRTLASRVAFEEQTSITDAQQLLEDPTTISIAALVTEDLGNSGLYPDNSEAFSIPALEADRAQLRRIEGGPKPRKRSLFPLALSAVAIVVLAAVGLVYWLAKPADNIVDVAYAISYVDAETGEQIRAGDYACGEEGEKVSLSAPEIEGYEFVDATQKDSEGKTKSFDGQEVDFELKAADDSSTIVFSYAKTESVLVSFVDKSTSKEVADEITLKGANGNTVTATAKAIKKYKYLGYSLVKGSEKSEGEENQVSVKLTSGSIPHITFFYQKETVANEPPKKEPESEPEPEPVNLVEFYVHYVDDDTGDELVSPERRTGVVGETIEISPRAIDGYVTYSETDRITLKSGQKDYYRYYWSDDPDEEDDPEEIDEPDEEDDPDEADDPDEVDDLDEEDDPDEEDDNVVHYDVRYEDTEGNIIAPDDHHTGLVGDTVIIYPKEIEGYINTEEPWTVVLDEDSTYIWTQYIELT